MFSTATTAPKSSVLRTCSPLGGSRNRAGAKCRAVKQDQAAGPAPATIDRRALIHCAGALALTSALPALADSESSVYVDAEDKFSLVTPPGWTLTIPQEPFDRFRSGTSAKRTFAWVSPEGTDLSMVVIINSSGADYTSLGSFGTAAQFGQNMIVSIDRSFTLKNKTGPVPDDVMVAKLLNTSGNGQSYFMEYTSKRGEQPQKHLYSCVALGNNAAASKRFYTVTATIPEDRVADVGPMVQSAVNSFKLV